MRTGWQHDYDWEADWEQEQRDADAAQGGGGRRPHPLFVNLVGDAGPSRRRVYLVQELDFAICAAFGSCEDCEVYYGNVLAAFTDEARARAYAAHLRERHANQLFGVVATAVEEDA